MGGNLTREPERKYRQKIRREDERMFLHTAPRELAEWRKSTFLASPQSPTREYVNPSPRDAATAGPGSICITEYQLSFSPSQKQTHLSFRLGAPPPTHQSTMQRRAFKLSSLPPFPFPLSAIPFNVSKAFVLCRGLLWTNKVSALSLSDSVPDWIILDRKLASDEDEFEDDEVWKVWTSVSCNSDDLNVSEAS